MIIVKRGRTVVIQGAWWDIVFADGGHDEASGRLW